MRAFLAFGSVALVCITACVEAPEVSEPQIEMGSVDRADAPVGVEGHPMAARSIGHAAVVSPAPVEGMAPVTEAVQEDPHQLPPEEVEHRAPGRQDVSCDGDVSLAGRWWVRRQTTPAPPRFVVPESSPCEVGSTTLREHTDEIFDFDEEGGLTLLEERAAVLSYRVLCSKATSCDFAADIAVGFEGGAVCEAFEGGCDCVGTRDERIRREGTWKRSGEDVELVVDGERRVLPVQCPGAEVQLGKREEAVFMRRACGQPEVSEIVEVAPLPREGYGSEKSMAAFWTGEHYALIRLSEARRIELTLLDERGAQVREVALMGDNDPDAENIGVAFDGDQRFMVAWTGWQGQVNLRTYDLDGQLVASSSLGDGWSLHQTHVDVLWRGDGFVVAYPNQQQRSSFDLHIHRFSRDGEPVESIVARDMPLDACSPVGGLDVVWTGAAYGVIYENSSFRTVSRFTEVGTEGSYTPPVILGEVGVYDAVVRSSLVYDEVRGHYMALVGSGSSQDRSRSRLELLALSPSGGEVVSREIAVGLSLNPGGVSMVRNGDRLALAWPSAREAWASQGERLPREIHTAAFAIGGEAIEAPTRKTRSPFVDNAEPILVPRGDEGEAIFWLTRGEGERGAGVYFQGPSAGACGQ